MPPAEYASRVLAAIYRAGLDHRDDRALYVDYRDLPEAFFSRVLPAFRIDCGDDERAAMAGRTAFDAKYPKLRFAVEGTASPSELPPDMAEAVERRVRPVYEELRAC
jgi:hypothetical protein